MLTPEQEVLFGAYKDALLAMRDACKEASAAEKVMLDAQARDNQARSDLRAAQDLLQGRRGELERSLK